MKIKRNIFFGFVSMCLIAACVITACNKESSHGSTTTPPGMQKVTVSLNDGPLDSITSVVVDIRFVEVKVDTGKVHHDDDYYNDDHEGEDHRHEGDEEHHGDQFGKWDTLSITPGLYDLLKLRNGIDTLIASGFSHIGKITKIRITLGPNDSLTTDSVHVFPLPICDGSPYVYANIRSNSIDSLPGGQFAIHIDFNVAKSIDYDDGQYCLRPEIKVYCRKNSGTIEGIVHPEDSRPHVMIFNSSDTAYAMPEDEGNFEVRGLSAGSYTVSFLAQSPFKDTTLLNIQVQNGVETRLPTITLHQ
ncbi:MAG TPA: DUF4382 domain-containing protein [Puia sp.]|jgi:hypothetical protein|nr:DUF4382 domain-containing protein [Puia sp.]